MTMHAPFTVGAKSILKLPRETSNVQWTFVGEWVIDDVNVSFVTI